MLSVASSHRTPKQSPRIGGFASGSGKYDSLRKARAQDLSINLGTIEETTPEALANMARERGEGETGDEFKTVQTVRGKMLRAARLMKAQGAMEFATVYDESSLLATASVYDDVHRESNFIVSTMVKQVDIPRVKSQYEFYFHEEFKRRGKIDDKSIINRVTTARKNAAVINKEVDSMIYEHDREAHLMRHFLIDNLSGYSREVAPRYLFSKNNMPEMVEQEMSIAARAAATSRQFIFLALMLALAGFEFLFVVVVGGEVLGTKSFELWLNVLIYSIVIDAVIMQFAITYLRCVVLRNTFMAEISYLCQTLKERTLVL